MHCLANPSQHISHLALKIFQFTTSWVLLRLYPFCYINHMMNADHSGLYPGWNRGRRMRTFKQQGVTGANIDAQFELLMATVRMGYARPLIEMRARTLASMAFRFRPSLRISE